MTDVSNAARALVSRSWADANDEVRQRRTAPGLAVINARLRALVDPTGQLPEHEVAARLRAVRADRLAANVRRPRPAGTSSPERNPR